MPATHLSYSIPPGSNNTLDFQTGASAPLTDLRFVLGGKPQNLRVSQINGQIGRDPLIQFDPPASPHEVTVFFAQNPIASSPSAAFFLFVDNSGSEADTLQVTAIYD